MIGKADRLDDIVNDCVERMARGEPVERCLASYPEHRGRLAPLLEVAATTLRAASAVSHGAVARERGLHRLNQAIARRKVRSGPRFPRFVWRSPVSRPVVAGAFVLLLATGLAFGTDAAASDSVPGDPLYWFKTSKESLLLMLPKSDMSRAEDHARLARERSDEIGRLMDRGRFVDAERHWSQVNQNLSQSVRLVGLRMSTNPTEMPSRGVSPGHQAGLDSLTASLQRSWSASRGVLAAHLVSAPPEDRAMVVGLMRQNDLIYRTLIAFLESGASPTWTPFYRTEPPGRFRR